MKFATFNLLQFLAPPNFWYERNNFNTYKPEEWEQKKVWISQQLERMNADVVGFQEVFSAEELKVLCQNAGYPYFLQVEESICSSKDPQVWVKPIVALASRTPITAQHEVPIPTEIRQSLLLSDDFHFSRRPVCATLENTELGTIRVYVLHLKSKRPIEPIVTYDDAIPWRDRVHDTMKRLSRGNIAAMLQRGAEASLVYHDIANELHLNPSLPVLVLGDLNDDQHSTPLAALTLQSRIYSIGGVEERQWGEDTKKYIHQYRLNDTFELAPNMQQRARPHTHIFHGEGGVLDYILVSNSLTNRNPDARAEVVHYKVLHDHLDDDGIPNRLQSDHGQVVVDIRPVRDEVHLPDPQASVHNATPLTSAQILTRQDFIQLAGGVYQSPTHYNQWDGSDKYQNFWGFFFDHDYGWVKSIYGLVPIDELFQKQHQSIEHIIPRIFLDEYFNQHPAPRNVRNGATTNPFNLAASERQLNARRSNFPFAMVDGIVQRPERLDLNPDEYSGFNQSNQWVIPSRNRGDVARAILYMLLTYGIDELYNQHLEVLIHWAKVDTPAAWELAYNEWVYKRLGIRNPFIDSPENSRQLLDNATLMDGIRLR